MVDALLRNAIEELPGFAELTAVDGRAGEAGDRIDVGRFAL
jgi:hypothetical protein